MGEQRREVYSRSFWWVEIGPGSLIYNLRMTLSFFSRASFEELHSLKLNLLVFGQLSRLRINLNKSTISGINISQDQIARLVSLPEWAISYWALMYLGLLLGRNPNSLSFWDPVLDRVSRRLDWWKKNLFVLRR